MTTMSVVLDELIRSGSVQPASMAQAFDKAHHRLAAAGFHQAANQMGFLRTVVMTDAEQTPRDDAAG